MIDSENHHELPQPAADEVDEELRLAPLEVEPTAEQKAGAELVRKILEPPAVPLTDAQLAERQFSLKQMFGLMTFVALLLAPMSHVRADIYAGLLGVTMLAMMTIMSVFQLRQLVVEAAFWLLVATYFLAIFIALTGYHPAG